MFLRFARPDRAQERWQLALEGEGKRLGQFSQRIRVCFGRSKSPESTGLTTSAIQEALLFHEEEAAATDEVPPPSGHLSFEAFSHSCTALGMELQIGDFKRFFDTIAIQDKHNPDEDGPWASTYIVGQEISC